MESMSEAIRNFYNILIKLLNSLYQFKFPKNNFPKSRLLQIKKQEREITKPRGHIYTTVVHIIRKSMCEGEDRILN